MRNEKQETIEDIVDDIRAQNQGLPEDSYALSPLVCDLLSLADRIEAAEKREREATREKSSRVGNAAKIRKALSDACYAMFNFLKTQNCGYEEMAKALDKAKAALAEPPRNCDVGTAEEQAERFRRFCGTHKPDESQFTEEGELLCPSTGCELTACNYGQCALAWSHMPYEEGGTK